MISFSGIINGMIGTIIVLSFLLFILSVLVYFVKTEYCRKCGYNKYKRITMGPHHSSAGHCLRCGEDFYRYGVCAKEYTSKKIPEDWKIVLRLKLKYHLNKFRKDKK